MVRSLSMFLFIALFTVSLSAQSPKKNAAPKSKPKTGSVKLSTNEEKMSYLSGYDLGLKVSANVKQNDFPLRNAAFIGGLRSALEGEENQLSADEIKAVLEVFQKMSPQAKEAEKLAAIAGKYHNEGEEYCAANAKNDSVKVTASGLQYKILREGTGKSPADTSSVTVHYRGRLINGVVFDESYARNEPSTFRLNQVIRGWTEGLQLMKEGAKFEFTIPSNLAYGDQPAGRLIPPGSTLIFEVELITVN